MRVEPKIFGLNAGLRTRRGAGQSTTLAPGIDIGDTPQSDAVGIVVESRDDAIPTDATVVGIVPWADSGLCEGSSLRVIDADANYVSHLTLPGHVGLTTYPKLVTLGGLKAGETVWRRPSAGSRLRGAVRLSARSPRDRQCVAKPAHRLSA